MATTVDKKPVSQSLNPYVVRAEVKGNDWEVWDRNLTFLNGYNKHVVFSNRYTFYSGSGIAAQTYPALLTSHSFTYWKSPGTQVLMIEYELATTFNGDTLPVRNAYVDLLTGSANVRFFPSSSMDPSITGSQRLTYYPHESSSNVPVLRTFLDVSNMVTNSWAPFHVVVRNDLGAGDPANEFGPDEFQRYGLHRLHVVECALQTTGSSGIGLDTDWTKPSKPIVLGHLTSSFGEARIADQLRKARSSWRKTFQIGAAIETYTKWIAGNGTNSLLKFQLRTGRDFALKWRHQVRNTYGTGTTTVPYTVAVLAQPSHQNYTGSFNIHYGVSGSSTYNIQPITISPSQSIVGVTREWYTGTVNFPTTGSNGDIEFWFTGTSTRAGTELFVYNVAMHETQS